MMEALLLLFLPVFGCLARIIDPAPYTSTEKVMLVVARSMRPGSSGAHLNALNALSSLSAEEPPRLSVRPGAQPSATQSHLSEAAKSAAKSSQLRVGAKGAPDEQSSSSINRMKSGNLLQWDEENRLDAEAPGKAEEDCDEGLQGGERDADKEVEVERKREDQREKGEEEVEKEEDGLDEEEEDDEPSPTPPFGKRKFAAGRRRVQSLFAEFQEAVQRYLADRAEAAEDAESAALTREGRRAEDLADGWPEEILRAGLRVLVRCRQGLRGPRGPRGAGRRLDTDAELLPRMRECLRGRMLAAMDNLISTEAIPLSGGMQLVRKPSSRSARGGVPVDLVPLEEAVEPLDGDEESAVLERPLAPRLLSKLGELLTTHELQLQYSHSPQEGRRRHQYRKVFPILVTGFMILISLMVPLGFQFMAMIGGKALLMSKMALVMASMYNLRRTNLPLGSQHVPAPTFHVSSPHIIDHVGPYEH